MGLQTSEEWNMYFLELTWLLQLAVIVLQLLWGLSKVLMNHLTTFFLFLLKKTEQNKYDL